MSTVAERSPTTGQFLNGNKIGLGNVNARRMHELRKEILAATSPELVIAVWEKISRQALDGCTTSQKMFMEYTLGRPTQAIEISGDQGGPINLQALVARISFALRDDPAARFKLAAVLHDLRGEEPKPEASDRDDAT
jgi:hypothetical protein